MEVCDEAAGSAAGATGAGTGATWVCDADAEPAVGAVAGTDAGTRASSGWRTSCSTRAGCDAGRAAGAGLARSLPAPGRGSRTAGAGSDPRCCRSVGDAGAACRGWRWVAGSRAGRAALGRTSVGVSGTGIGVLAFACSASRPRTGSVVVGDVVCALLALAKVSRSMAGGISPAPPGLVNIVGIPSRKTARGPGTRDDGKPACDELHGTNDQTIHLSAAQ